MVINSNTELLNCDLWPGGSLSLWVVSLIWPLQPIQPWTQSNNSFQPIFKHFDSSNMVLNSNTDLLNGDIWPLGPPVLTICRHLLSTVIPLLYDQIWSFYVLPLWRYGYFSVFDPWPHTFLPLTRKWSMDISAYSPYTCPLENERSIIYFNSRLKNQSFKISIKWPLWPWPLTPWPPKVITFVYSSETTFRFKYDIHTTNPSWDILQTTFKKSEHDNSFRIFWPFWKISPLRLPI